MKHLIIGLLFGVVDATGAAAGIVYTNELPWCAVNPLDGCKMVKLQTLEAERKALAARLAEAGFTGESIEAQLDKVLQTHHNTLTSAQAILQTMHGDVSTQPITNINLALARANQKLNEYSGRVNELETILCAAPSMATHGSCNL